jgi:hypothetical protein
MDPSVTSLIPHLQPERGVRKNYGETQNPMGPSFPNPVLQAPNSARTFDLNDAGGLLLIGGL